jgi:EAL domain-containing protein (putative c-di-GMP-specific phosphodiesterase class I)
MLKQLKIKVIAEGVETKDQADYLLNEGCADLQGFYFYKAMKVEEFEKLFLKENDNE